MSAVVALARPTLVAHPKTGRNDGQQQQEEGNCKTIASALKPQIRLGSSRRARSYHLVEQAGQHSGKGAHGCADSQHPSCRQAIAQLSVLLGLANAIPEMAHARLKAATSLPMGVNASSLHSSANIGEIRAKTPLNCPVHEVTRVAGNTKTKAATAEFCLRISCGLRSNISQHLSFQKGLRKEKF